AERRASVTSAVIVSMAGQPEYVGVMVTTTVPSITSTARKMPRSSMVITGTSGSGTVLTISQSSAACCSAGRREAAVITMSLLDVRVQVLAFQQEYVLVVQSSGPTGHHPMRLAHRAALGLLVQQWV